MQQVELSDQLQTVLQHTERRVQVINYILAFLLTVVLVWGVYLAWLNSQQPKIESLTLVPGSVRLVSPTALCPGDTLKVAYALDVDGSGVIVSDDTVTKDNHTVKFSVSRREFIDHTLRNIYEDEWTIPDKPEMAINDRLVWVPGKYVRYISIAASNAYISRYTAPALVEVPFTIRSGCK